MYNVICKTDALHICSDVLHCENAPLVEFTYLVFSGMPSESYCRPFRSLLLHTMSCEVFRALINSLCLPIL